MYKVIFKGNETWFAEPIQADEVTPAEGWEVEEFTAYDEAQSFIESLKTDSK